jgi:hypothetical protein
MQCSVVCWGLTDIYCLHELPATNYVHLTTPKHHPTPAQGMIYMLDGLKAGPVLVGECENQDWLEVVMPAIRARTQVSVCVCRCLGLMHMYYVHMNTHHSHACTHPTSLYYTLLHHPTPLRASATRFISLSWPWWTLDWTH